MANAYEVLGVARADGDAAIKAAFRDGLKRHHPDQNRDQAGAADATAAIVEAYATLRSPAKRRALDRALDTAEWMRAHPQGASGTRPAMAGTFDAATANAYWSDDNRGSFLGEDNSPPATIVLKMALALLCMACLFWMLENSVPNWKDVTPVQGSQTG